MKQRVFMDTLWGAVCCTTFKNPIFIPHTRKKTWLEIDKLPNPVIYLSLVTKALQVMFSGYCKGHFTNSTNIWMHNFFFCFQSRSNPGQSSLCLYLKPGGMFSAAELKQNFVAIFGFTEVRHRAHSLIYSASLLHGI